MSSYHEICPKCEDETITHGWSPSTCPFCKINQLQRELAEMTKQRDHYKTACDQYSEDETLNMLAEARKQRDTLAEQCRALLDSDEVQKVWPLDGTRRAEKPSDTHSSATVTVKFRRLLAIHSALAAVKGGSDE